jgi:poly(A)-specific ribonuclease
LKWPPENVNVAEKVVSVPVIAPPKLENEDWFTDEMGFSKVMTAIAEAQKPLIGHNCMYDCLYCYNQFIGKLPATYVEFITEWNRLFPHTYDSKVIAERSKYFGRTILNVVYEKTQKDDAFNLPLSFAFDSQFTMYDGNKKKCHEAAFDAYMTGVVFAKTLKRKEVDSTVSPIESKVTPESI